MEEVDHFHENERREEERKEKELERKKVYYYENETLFTEDIYKENYYDSVYT